MPGQLTVKITIDQPSQACQQAIASASVEAPDVREGAEQIEVAGCGVAVLLLIEAMLDRHECRRIPELGSGRRQFVDGRRDEAWPRRRVPALVAVLAADAEQVTVLTNTPVSVDDGQVAVGFQRSA